MGRKVTVRSSETSNVFTLDEEVAKRHDTITILTGSEAVTAESEAQYAALDYNDLRAEVTRRNAVREDDDRISPTSQKAADLIAALVADDKEN